MSNKFLPFITEKSGPETIFKATVKASSSTSQLATIYPSILRLGIEHIRRYLNRLPSNLSNEEIIIKLVDKYTAISVPTEVVNYWECIVKIQGVETIKNSNNYSLNELAIMVASVASVKPEDLGALGIYNNRGRLVAFSKPDFDCNTSYLTSMEFSSNSNIKVGFTSKTEFKAYIALKVSYPENCSSPMFQFTPVKIKHYEGIPNNPEERLENGPY